MMKQPITITAEQYPEDWETIISCDYELVDREHRRGSTFYCYMLVNITEEDQKELYPGKPELIGTWISDRLIWDDDNGLDDNPSVLYKAVKKEILVPKYDYVLIYE